MQIKTNSIIGLSLFSVGIILFSFTKAHAGSLEMTTYYPSPSGNYDDLIARNLGVGTLTVNNTLNVASLNVAADRLTVNANGITKIQTSYADPGNSQGIFTVRQLGTTYGGGMPAILAGTDNLTGSSNYLFEGRIFQTLGAPTPYVRNFAVRADGEGSFANNLGVGTMFPLHRLHVEGSSAAGGEIGLSLFNRSNAAASKSRFIQQTGITNATVENTITNDAGATYGQYQVLAGNAIFTGNYYMPMHIFYTKNAFSADPWVERMKIDQAGNVGIGVTTPLSQLQIGNGFNFTPDWPTMTLNCHFVGANCIYNVDKPAAMIQLDNTNGNLYFTTAPTGVTGAVVAFNTGLTQKSDGNVGIGITPSQKLDVNGIIRTNGNNVGHENIGGTMQIGTRDANKMDLYTNSAVRLTVDANGNVGIGHPAPNNKLLVTRENVGECCTGASSTPPGALSYAVAIAENTSVTGNMAGIQFHNAAVSEAYFRLANDSAFKHFEIGGNQGSNVGLTITGRLEASSFNYPSDERLKEDIVPLTGALKDILHLNGVRFKWKKTDEKEIGVIAQNVEKVLPDLVVTGADGMKGVKYINLVPVLIEAIKEQQEQIELLNKKVAFLEKEVLKR